ncbi:MAG: ABC transporter permease [Acidobacteria bacterium]|nr:ABC transporter permease [Acidobacteriota bacterium]
MWLIATLLFVFFAVIDQNPMDVFVDPRLSQATKMRIETQFGYDQSIGVQYLLFLKGCVTGQLGMSFVYKQPVAQVLAPTMLRSLILGTISVTIAVLGCLAWLSVMARSKSYRAKWVPVILLVVPSLVWAVTTRWLLLTVFDWYPFASYTGGMFRWSIEAVIPALTLALPVSGYLALCLQARLDEMDHMPFVIAAWGRGASQQQILWRHKFRQLWPTAVQLLALHLPAIAGGSLVIECIFGFSGLGLLLVDAALGRDLPLLSAASLYVSALGLLGYELGNVFQRRQS